MGHSHDLRVDDLSDDEIQGGLLARNAFIITMLGSVGFILATIIAIAH